MPQVKPIKLSDIHTDGGTQARDELNQEAVRDYADAMKAGTTLPPITVFHDGSAYWLADGFHRYFAAQRNEAKTIRCEVHKGSQADAQLYAAHANATNGIRRTNKDKRAAVGICVAALKQTGQDWSERKIAEHCGVSHTLVTEVRAEAGEREQQPAVTRKKKGAKTGGAPTVGAQNPPSEPESPISENGGQDGAVMDLGSKEPSVEALRGGKPKKPGEEKVGAKDRTKAYQGLKAVVQYLDAIGKLKPYRKALEEIIELIEPGK